MNSSPNPWQMLAAQATVALLAAGCVSPRQLSDIQPGMTMAQVRGKFGRPDRTIQNLGDAQNRWRHPGFTMRITAAASSNGRPFPRRGHPAGGLNLDKPRLAFFIAGLRLFSKTALSWAGLNLNLRQIGNP